MGKNSLLGPVFEHALHDKWETHLPRMVDFWSSILLGMGKFQGNVYGKHMALAGIGKEHFVRCLSLFRNMVTVLFEDASANKILETADRIAGSLQLGYFGVRTVRLSENEFTCQCHKINVNKDTGNWLSAQQAVQPDGTTTENLPLVNKKLPPLTQDSIDATADKVDEDSK
jgi:hemoglobin